MTEAEIRSEDIDLARLVQALAETLDFGQLQTLSFALRIDFDSLPTRTLSKAEKARALVQECQRTGRLLELLAECQRQRPQIDWDSFVRRTEPADSPFKGLQYFKKGMLLTSMAVRR